MSEGGPGWIGSAVILIDRGGRLLLQLRDDESGDGSATWSIPGGQSLAGESPRETALREFREETGAGLMRLRYFAALTPADVPGWDVARLDLFFADDDLPRDRLEVRAGLDLAYWTPEGALALPLSPYARVGIERFVAHDMYRGTVAFKASFKVGVTVIEMDRWGRVLLQLRDDDLPPERFPGHWSLPGGLLEPGESPDAGAIREFEEETGFLLEELKLFRVYRREVDLPGASVDIQHVYYVDADLDEDLVEVGEGQAFRYHAPAEALALILPPATRTILSDFFRGAHYRALFH